MTKTILVITGSPREGGNSDRLADAFIEGATEAGNTVERFDAGRANIGGCHDCRACFASDDKACSYVDDFNTLAPMIARADVLVYITPVYCYSWPSNIKACMDKMISFAYGEKKLHIGSSMLIAVGEDKDPSMFDAFIASYDTMAKYCHWNNLGHLMVDSCWEKGAIEQRPEALAQAKAMGAGIE